MLSRFATLGRIPRGVWILGGVSLLMDVSSEMIHSLLPLFMATTLGVSVIVIGLIEGLAEATALVVKVFSGVLSDYLGKRKGWRCWATGWAPSANRFCRRVVVRHGDERASVGSRGQRHPRRAARRPGGRCDAAGNSRRGLWAAPVAGYRRRLLGPLLAVGLMLLWHNDFRAIFWVAAIPAALAIALLFFGLKEPAAAITDKRTNPITRANLRLLERGYWWVVGIGAVFTLARFSEAFLVLKAQQGGTPLALIPLVMVAMNLVYACSAYPFGKLSDRMSHKGMLKAGLLVLIAADVVLALSDHWAGVLFGVALWGVHMGMTQGLLAAMVTHTAPAHLRGTAFGMFNLVSGVALLLASLGAGMLWERVGSASTFTPARSSAW